MEFATLRVLVVEDHDFQRSVAVNMLKRIGVREVSEATDGESALRCIRELSGPLDIILCDLNMPGMDGIELIRHIAQEDVAASLVVVSGLDASLVSSVEAMAKEHGMNVLGVIEKPVTAQKLSNLFQRYRPGGSDTAKSPIFITASEVRHALVTGEFLLAYQPKVDIATRAVVGAECLVRWRHPIAGLIEPRSFLAAVDEQGAGAELSWVVLNQALDQLQAWRASGLATTLSVNLSLIFLENVGVADRIAGEVAARDIDFSSVIVEVTERLATAKFAHVTENLARLRMKGFGISIDDYGTGYSSVQQLSRIPFTELKIDQSFVSGAVSKDDMRAILDTSLQLARRLGLKSVAEGIEREEEWSLLKALGCDMAQGYYIARPMSGDEFPRWRHDWMVSLET